MSRLSFSPETVAGWLRLRPDDDLLGLGVVHGLIRSGRLAEELLERTADPALGVLTLPALSGVRGAILIADESDAAVAGQAILDAVESDRIGTSPAGP